MHVATKLVQNEDTYLGFIKLLNSTLNLDRTNEFRYILLLIKNSDFFFSLEKKEHFNGLSDRFDEIYVGKHYPNVHVKDERRNCRGRGRQVVVVELRTNPQLLVNVSQLACTLHFTTFSVLRWDFSKIKHEYLRSRAYTCLPLSSQLHTVPKQSIHRNTRENISLITVSMNSSISFFLFILSFFLLPYFVSDFN